MFVLVIPLYCDFLVPYQVKSYVDFSKKEKKTDSTRNNNSPKQQPTEQGDLFDASPDEDDEVVAHNTSKLEGADYFRTRSHANDQNIAVRQENRTKCVSRVQGAFRTR
eukprot:g16901.t1